MPSSSEACEDQCSMYSSSCNLNTYIFQISCVYVNILQQKKAGKATNHHHAFVAPVFVSPTNTWMSQEVSKWLVNGL